MIDIQTVLTLIEKLTVALFILQKTKIIHLDVKSENILIKKLNINGKTSFDFFLTDFGHSITTDRVKDIIDACSLNYRAPELLFNQEFDNRADIQSLGIIFLEMLLGYNPFKAKSRGECIFLHQQVFGEFQTEQIDKSLFFNRNKYFDSKNRLLKLSK